MFFFLVKHKNAADDNIQHKNCNGVEWNDQGWSQWDNAQHQANLDRWEKVDDKGWGQWDNDQEVPNIFEENIQETQMETENLEENEDNAKQHSENSETQNKQDDTEEPKNKKDLVESIRVRAHDLIEEKLLFDTDLKIALQEYPNNVELLLIADVINSVFHPRKEDSNAVNANETSTEQDQNETTRNETVIQDDYFQLRPEDIEEMDLIGYVTRTKCTSDALDAFPSFSLGIDDEIIDKVCDDINAEEESNLLEEATEKDIFITPKPAIREKSTRLMRLTRYGKSPYIERVIDISGKFTNQDYGLWRFLIQNRDPLEDLFSWNGLSCLRENMQTFKINTSLSYSVVDTWSILLNDNEKYKADESPMRLFCTIGCVHPTLDDTKSVSLTYPLFADNMDEILKRFKREKLDDTDMVFFPIYAYEHFYLICYNLKNPAYELIDNVKREEDPKVYYGAKPRILHSHFEKYLQAKGHSTLAKTVRKLKPSYMTMPWQTTKNSKDCGIFLMRHMETYKGDTKTWETRFREEKHGQVAQIIKMRVKYNNAILSSKLNEKRQPIMEEGLKLYNEAAANRVLNLVIQSSQLSQEEQRTDYNKRSPKKKTVTFAKNLTMTFEEEDQA
ncbi:hypothetical protein POM88_040090 [Heracleum sosnowskyi]|uniref:Ubiquitin-like protease family profile domain-containing protein n=1 Tax=Heracleum sosnowskyi TaxID=360622 RepID=A0AAD8HDV6_9APIA|nr:hypothetical protein POM88_040090 [Heracleum sosnowskyi]